MSNKNDGLVEADAFESVVHKSLVEAGLDFSGTSIVAAAVSGGADSISLLTALHHVLPKNITLVAVTVNHNIRPQEETEGDADFVEQYCHQLGLQCRRYDIPRGKVQEYINAYGCGMEDAARRLRYQCFEAFIAEYSPVFLCLAHNLNDQNETMLMRFFHGAGTGELRGIPKIREKYLRPLLNIDRKSIESYLKIQNISYRTDSTNSDVAMYRNCIRNVVVPVLDENIIGWKQGMAGVAQKAMDDEEFLQMAAENSLKTIGYEASPSGVTMNFESFSGLSRAIKRRILYKALGEVKASARIPYTFIEGIMKLSGSEDFKECISGLEFSVKSRVLSIQKAVKIATQSSFFVIIQEAGTYEAGPWNVRVSSAGHGMELEFSCVDEKIQDYSIALPDLEFPFALRNRQIGDSVRTADGKYKNLSKILKDWKVEDRKDQLILIQRLSSCSQEIYCILGEPLGFRNWIVKN